MQHLTIRTWVRNRKGCVMRKWDSMLNKSDHREYFVKMLCNHERNAAFEISGLCSVHEIAEVLISCNHKARILRNILEEYKL